MSVIFKLDTMPATQKYECKEMWVISEWDGNIEIKIKRYVGYNLHDTTSQQNQKRQLEVNILPSTVYICQ